MCSVRCASCMVCRNSSPVQQQPWAAVRLQQASCKSLEYDANITKRFYVARCMHTLLRQSSSQLVEAGRCAPVPETTGCNRAPRAADPLVGPPLMFLNAPSRTLTTSHTLRSEAVMQTTRLLHNRLLACHLLNCNREHMRHKQTLPPPDHNAMIHSARTTWWTLQPQYHTRVEQTPSAQSPVSDTHAHDARMQGKHGDCPVRSR